MNHRTPQDIRQEVAAINARIRTLTNELDGVRYCLRGTPGWTALIGERSRLLNRRAELNEAMDALKSN